jgi:hypothetical protein
MAEPALPPNTVPMVEVATGKRVPVPQEQASQAFHSGQFGFAQGQQVPTVDAAGKVGMRSAEELSQALQAGESLATHEQYREAHLDAQYGGVGGALAATGEGLARGASLGLSDPLAVGAARLFGGDDAAEKVRTHLAEEKEAHGALSTGAELLGAGAPLLLSGGASAPEQAATLGARAVGAAGEAGVFDKIAAQIIQDRIDRGALSTGAELLGAGAPLLLSGGASAPEQAATLGARAVGAAGEAGVFGKMAEGLGTLGRTLGALPRGVGAAGDFAEHAVSGLLGAGGDSALGTAGRAAAKTAARAMTEAGLFGGGGEISEDTLKNTPLTAEKLFAAVGHSALMGGALGGALAGTGSLVGSAASSALGAAGPKLDDLRGYQIWKWLSPRNTEAKLASRAGGASAVGNTAWELAFRPAIEEQGIASVAAMSHEDKLGLIQGALDKVGARIGEADSSGATIPLRDFLEPIEKRMAEHGNTLLGHDKVAVLQQLKDDVTRILGGADFQEKEIGSIARKAAQDAGYEAGSDASAQFEARYAERLKKGGAYDIGEAPVPIAEALKQRRALQQVAFAENKAMDPKLRVQLLRDISSDWNGLEAKALDEASANTGGIAGDQFRALNKQFQQLSVAEETIKNTTSRYAANNSLSLSDNLYGALHMGGAIAAGHPLGALGAVATAYGHKALRMQGNAYAAVLLDKLSTWGGVARASADVDSAVARAVGKAVSGPEESGLRRLPRAFMADTGTGSEDEYERERERISQIAALPAALTAAHLQEKTQPLGTHAPQLAQAMQSQAMVANAYLVKHMPPLPPIDPLQGVRSKGSGVAAPIRNDFLRRVKAVDGGTEHALEQLRKGRLSSADVETMHEVFPHSMAEVQSKLRIAAADQGTRIPYQKRLQIGLFLGEPTDATMDPRAGLALQEMQTEANAEPAQPKDKEGPAKLSLQESLQTPFERAASG